MGKVDNSVGVKKRKITLDMLLHRPLHYRDELTPDEAFALLEQMFSIVNNIAPKLVEWAKQQRPPAE
jgi:hypothetical protein